MVNEIDKIDEGEIEVTADELIILKELTNNTFINPGEDNSNKSISYPYDVTFLRCNNYGYSLCLCRRR